jgi:hypothetical protein
MFRQSAPPLVPGFDVEVCIVLDDFGKVGRAYREVDEQQADRETIIRDILSGQYEQPIRIVAFNTFEGWSQDITEDVAREVEKRAREQGRELGFAAGRFVEYFSGSVS